MCREVLDIEQYQIKLRSPERGKAWETISSHLNATSLTGKGFANLGIMSAYLHGNAKTLQAVTTGSLFTPMVSGMPRTSASMGMSIFRNLNSDRHSDSVISSRLNGEKSSYGKQGFFHSKRSDNTKNASSSMKLDVWLKKRFCIVLKDSIAKNFVANEQFCVYIQCRRRPTERLYLKFPISRRN